jgi:hypothetical protein
MDVSLAKKIILDVPISINYFAYQNPIQLPTIKIEIFQCDTSLDMQNKKKCNKSRETFARCF